MLRRSILLVPVLTLGASAALALPTAAQAAPPATTAGKTYVALGDSYAAGYGIPTTAKTPDGAAVKATRTDIPGCMQTSGDYPHILAAQLGLTLTDVSCQGAETTNFTTKQDLSQYQSPDAPPQLDVFKTVQPDLVSITIGGNDLGFSQIALDCLAGTPLGPIVFHRTPSNGPIPSCKDYYTDPSLSANGAGVAANPYSKIDSVVAAVKAAVVAVRAAAPNAKVVVIAYPAIAPDVANTPSGPGGCFAANPATNPGFPADFPFTNADVPFLQVLQQQLDAGIGQAAAEAGASYADIYPSSLAHSACAPESARWVEPVVPDQVVAPGSTNRLHPNVAGTTAMASALASVVTALFAPPVTTAPPTTTSPTTGPSSGTSTTASTGPTLAGGGSPLADTGVDVPVPWTVGVAAVMLVAGGLLVRRARPRH